MPTDKNSLTRTTIALFFTKIFVLASFTNAQTIKGIYKTSTNFFENKLMYESTADKKYKIKQTHLFNRTVIKIKCNDTIFNLQKDSIYGFKDNDGVKCRIINNENYAVINDDTAILLYKISISPHCKYEPTGYAYFFSKKHDDKLYKLTIQNLEKAYAENKTFLIFLALYFKTNTELVEYNEHNKTYKINQLLTLSKS